MSDKLNYSVVEGKLSSFDASCDSLYNALKEMDSSVSEVVGTSGGAIYGALGSRLLKEWDYNCSMFLNFKGIFDELHDTAVNKVSSNAEFEQEAQEATKQVYDSHMTDTSAATEGEGTETGGTEE